MTDQTMIRAYCHHFVEDNSCFERSDAARRRDRIAAWVHLEDGEQEFDHDATPSSRPEDTKTGAQWKAQRQELFKEYPDGKIGPNSRHHEQPGKIAYVERGGTAYESA